MLCWKEEDLSPHDRGEGLLSTGPFLDPVSGNPTSKSLRAMTNKPLPFELGALIYDYSSNETMFFSLFSKFYTSIKTASEKLLTSYGAKEGETSSMEVVVLACGVVGGEALVDSVFGVANLFSPLTGDTVWLGNFMFLQNLLCSVPLVHLDDVCEAHLFCMDVPLTCGRRFLCASDYPSLGDIMAYHRLKYPHLIVKEPEECGSSIKGGSSRLRDMGFEYRYSMEQILDESILFANKLGLIKDS